VSNHQIPQEPAHLFSLLLRSPSELFEAERPALAITVLRATSRQSGAHRSFLPAVMSQFSETVRLFSRNDAIRDEQVRFERLR
jgi:hypothetical protein